MRPFFFRIAIVFATALTALQLSSCGGGGAPAQVDTTQMGGARQGLALALVPVVSTFAGAAPGADGIGLGVHFSRPSGIAFLNGYAYVTDQHSVRRIDIQTGEVTTLAGRAGDPGNLDGVGSTARFNGLTDIATDGAHLYVTDSVNMTIRKVDPATGAVSTLAGQTQSQGHVDGAALSARFGSLTAITSNGTHLFVADDRTIRRVAINNGEVHTLAGQYQVSGSADGIGGGALFSTPTGLTLEGNYLYVADDTIRRVDLGSNEVKTICGSVGSVSQDGPCSTAVFAGPQGIFKAGEYLYVVEAHGPIRQIDIANEQVTSLAGIAHTCAYANGVGPAARFCAPEGVTGNGGFLYVADTANCSVRQVDINSKFVSTLAGRGSPFFDINGTHNEARFSYPSGIATDGINLYVTASGSSSIRAISIATGQVSSLAGAGHTGSTDGIGLLASFNGPQGITTDGTHLFVADTQDHTIRRINIATQEVTTLAGQREFTGAGDGVGSAASLNYPVGITTDSTYLYVTDRDSHTIRQVDIATSAVLTIVGQAGNSGDTDGIGTSARLHRPLGITTDGLHLFVADSANHTIRKIVIATRTVSTLAGLAGVSGYDDGQGNTARFNTPIGITTDGTYLYVTDSENHTIRRVHIATGVVVTLTGSAGNQGIENGTFSAARFSWPFGITTDGKALYVTEDATGTIRKIQ